MKVRNVYICNLKALLIFLVVFGHFIERDIGTNSAVHALYRGIYLFHIPLFVFTSGFISLFAYRSGLPLFAKAYFMR